MIIFRKGLSGKYRLIKRCLELLTRLDCFFLSLVAQKCSKPDQDQRASKIMRHKIRHSSIGRHIQSSPPKEWLPKVIQSWFQRDISRTACYLVDPSTWGSFRDASKKPWVSCFKTRNIRRWSPGPTSNVIGQTESRTSATSGIPRNKRKMRKYDVARFVRHVTRKRDLQYGTWWSA